MNRALRALGLIVGLMLAVLVGIEIVLQAAHFAFFRDSTADTSIESPAELLAIGPSQRFRVLCVGESTTVGYPLEKGSANTYPKILERRLNAQFAGREFEVRNQGIIGVTTSTVLERLPAWLDAYRPHAIIAMTGINDQFYHNVAYVDDLPTRLLLALQQLRTYKLAALAWAQIDRMRDDPRSQAPAAIGHKAHLRMVGVYERARDHLLAERFGKAESLLSPLLTEVESLRVEDSTESDVGEMLTRIPVRLIGLYYELNTMLAEIYLRTGRVPDAEQLYHHAIALEPKLAGLHFELSRLYGRVGNPSKADEQRERANALLSEFVLTSTLDNYAGIRDLAAERGVALVAVQYPLRDVSHLKIMLGEGGAVSFVDNQRSFEEAVERNGYRAIFMDAFAGDFGHLTERGNELLVDNIFEQAIRGIVERSVER